MSLQSKGINIIFFILVLGSMLSGQTQGISLEIQSPEQKQDWLMDRFKVGKSYPDTASLNAALRKLILALHEQSYLEASLDTLLRKDSTSYLAEMHIGPAYEWVRLRPRKYSRKLAG